MSGECTRDALILRMPTPKKKMAMMSGISTSSKSKPASRTPSCSTACSTSSSTPPGPSLPFDGRVDRLIAASGKAGGSSAPVAV